MTTHRGIKWIDGEWLAGLKFSYRRGRDEPELDADRILEVRLIPVSGPIKLIVLESNPKGKGFSQSMREEYYAQCMGCGEMSRHYKRKHWGLPDWARDHRCRFHTLLDRMMPPEVGEVGRAHR